MAAAHGEILGVVLAGGRSRRFGWEKALFPLAGRPMAEWAARALRANTPRQLVITNDPAVSEALELPGRPDEIPGMGPLGGLHAALTAAEEGEAGGVFLLACDLPLVGPDMVGRILQAWPADRWAAVPWGHGPRGFEPLCAAYGVECLPDVEGLLRSPSHSMAALLDRVDPYQVPVGDLALPELLDMAFTNVNTQKQAARAAAFLEGSGTASLRTGVPSERGP